MITLQRIRKRRQTVGVLRVDGWSCYTLELPWRDNERRESCIPPAPGGDPVIYQAHQYNSPRYGPTLWVRGVEGRSEILVHAGNFLSDTEGCILVGSELTDLDGDSVTDVTVSQATLDALLSRAPRVADLKVEWSGKAHPADLEGDV
jgi:hypothetical protein